MAKITKSKDGQTGSFKFKDQKEFDDNNYPGSPLVNELLEAFPTKEWELEYSENDLLMEFTRRN